MEQLWARGWPVAFCLSPKVNGAERWVQGSFIFLLLTDMSSGPGPTLLILDKHTVQIVGKGSQRRSSC